MAMKCMTPLHLAALKALHMAIGLVCKGGGLFEA